MDIARNIKDIRREFDFNYKYQNYIGCWYNKQISPNKMELYHIKTIITTEDLENSGEIQIACDAMITTDSLFHPTYLSLRNNTLVYQIFNPKLALIHPNELIQAAIRKIFMDIH